MSGNSHRLFIALPLPTKLRDELARWSRTNKAQYPFQKWTHPDDLHITLFFLGDTSVKRIEEITHALASVGMEQPPFKLELDDIGAFGPPNSPSILWAGLAGDKNRLYSLQQAVSQALYNLGYPREDRAYKPHITLARRYNGNEPFHIGSRESKQPFPLHGADFECTTMVLYRSHLGRSPMYEKLVDIQLLSEVKV